MPAPHIHIADMEFWIDGGRLWYLPTSHPGLNWIFPGDGFIHAAPHRGSDTLDLVDSLGNEWLLKFEPGEFETTYRIELVKKYRYVPEDENA